MNATAHRPVLSSQARRLASVVALGALGLGMLAGCGNYNPEDQNFLRAVPRLIDVALQPPGAEVEESGGTQPGQMQQALSSCGEAPLRCQAQETATTFNGLTAGLLTVIDNAIQLPVTKRLDNRRVWGPLYIAEENLTVRFEMERIEDPESVHPYRFCIHFAKDKHDEWRLGDPITCDVEQDPETGLTLGLYGGMTPGQDAEELAASGAGRLIFDGNAIAQATGDDNPDLPAKFDISYDNFGGSQLIDIAISDVVDESTGRFTTAAYHYARQREGSGDFYFAIKADVNGGGIFAPPEPVLETFEIQAQWTETRNGAARAAIYGGDLGEYLDGTPVRWDVAECWDTSLDTTYLEHPDDAFTNVGEIGNCSIPIPAAL